MNNEEIKERLALISALTEDAQEGLEDMIVPFLLYGLTIPASTFATFVLVQSGLARFIWVLWLFTMTACQIFLILYMKRKQKIKIKRATDGIYAAVWISTGAGIALSMLLGFTGKLDFNAGFFNIGLCLALGYVMTAAIVQKKLRLFLYAEAVCWTACGTICLFTARFTAPCVIAVATFVLLALPAATALAVVKRKKTVPADEYSR